MWAVELENIGFRIGSFTISGVSLCVASGEYFSVTGPNGSGKSLLLKLITGIYVPDRGSVHVCGVDVTYAAPWTRNIGYVPQDGLLFPNRTVRRNIAFGLEVRHRRREDIESAVNDMANRLNICHLLDRKPAGLSGGERQKVSLGRALVLNPPILLLDEPVSAVDEDARDGLCKDLHRLQRELGLSVIHVAHNAREIELTADRVGRMEGGKWCGIRPGNLRNPGEAKQAMDVGATDCDGRKT